MQEIGLRVSALRSKYRRCSRRRGRDAQFPYLLGVFKLYRRLRRRSDKISAARRTLLQLQTVRSRRRQHIMRLIIDATAHGAPAKAKSRWTRALRFIWRERRRWRRFKVFVKEQGGIAGCADQWAALNPRYPKDHIVYRDPAGRVYLVVQRP